MISGRRLSAVPDQRQPRQLRSVRRGPSKGSVASTEPGALLGGGGSDVDRARLHRGYARLLWAVGSCPDTASHQPRAASRCVERRHLSRPEERRHNPALFSATKRRSSGASGPIGRVARAATRPAPAAARICSGPRSVRRASSTPWFNGSEGTLMPSFGSLLSTEQIWELHAFLLSRDRLE